MSTIFLTIIYPHVVMYFVVVLDQINIAINSCTIWDMTQVPNVKLELENGGVKNSKQGLTTAFKDDERPPTSSASFSPSPPLF